ncbi:hypothetical protein FN846DRAFT_891954 [Sphaerosporella brunnea]|uniref:P-loop containing nucleoside triphosphate hydrolase protein n=1 Tax=Sphaerosporella brunnea TaxID=1250544 RepID=A0A5J5ESC1_9PEZI|nr:hypothetical protein FN846DRAFT_891954 [Sphaerosporella brunnea]
MANALGNVDPFNYTIDQTIQALSLYLDKRDVEALRLNEVSGRVLLNTASYETLKTELGIIPLGRREGIMSVVADLRRRSEAYRNHILQYAANLPLPEDEDEEEQKLIASCYLPDPINTTAHKKRRHHNLRPRSSSPPRPPGLLGLVPHVPAVYVRAPFAPGEHGRKYVPLLDYVAEENRAHAERGGLDPSSSVFHDAEETMKIPDTLATLDDDTQGEELPMERTTLKEDSTATEPTKWTSIDVTMEDSSPPQLEPLVSEPEPELPAGPKRIAPTLVAPLVEPVEAADPSEPVPEPEPPAGPKRIAPTFIAPIFEPVEAADPSEPVPEPEPPAGPKRIAPTFIAPIFEPVEAADPSEPVPEPEPPAGPKRIAPTLVAPLVEPAEVADLSESEPEPEPEQPVRGRRLRKRYLPVKARKIETLFYDVEIGEEILLNDDEDDDFKLIPKCTRFPGEDRYVSRRICRLLKDNSQIIDDLDVGFATSSAAGQLVRVTRRDCPRFGIKHYGDAQRFLRKYEHQSFSVFDVEPNNTVRVHRQSMETLQLPWPPETYAAPKKTGSDIQIVRHADNTVTGIDPNDNSNHDFDYLLKWQNVDGGDEVLPLFGESDEENEYDVQTWREIQAEFGPLDKVPGRSSKRRIPLTTVEIEEAIAAAIRELVQIWRQKKFPKVEQTAYRLWRQAKKDRSRKLYTRKTRERIEHLENRLQKMKEEILAGEGDWPSKDVVRKKAKASMEVTIFEREEAKWYIDLLAHEDQPSKPPPRPKKSRTAVEVGENEVGEKRPTDDGADSDVDVETIGSESDEDRIDKDEDDEMAGFIVADPEVRELIQASQELEIDSSDEDVTDHRRRRRVVQDRREVQNSQDHDGDTNMGDGIASDGEDPVAIQVKSEHQSPPLVSQKSHPEVIDLTGDSPPRNSKPRTNRYPVQIVDLSLDDGDDDDGNDDDRAPPAKKAKPAPELETPRDRGFELLKQGLMEDPTLLFNMYFRIRDVGEQDFSAWFGAIKTGIKSWNKKNPGAKYSAHEEYLHKTMIKFYALRTLGSDMDRNDLTVQDRMALNNIENFRRFTRDVARIFKMDQEIGYEEAEEETIQLPADRNGAQKRGNKHYESDDEDELDDDNAPPSSHRKRKLPEFVESQASKKARENAMRANMTIQRRIRERQTQALAKGEVLGGGKLEINLGHLAKHSPIYIIDDIANILKPHQIEGVRFLWKTLVQTGLHTGALLAHTMGLGKTLQVITFLYTLAVAGSSPDKKVYEQIPEHLRKSKTLIICPPGLVENWWDEFHNWLPFDRNLKRLSEEYIGKLYRADSAIGGPQARSRIIAEWNSTGGVLLMGFQTFRAHVMPPKVTEETENVKEILWKGPNVIVADEAHYLKNRKNGKLAGAASQFESKSRIAMTGSPLANNLEEYWAMIDWIDPGYLGDEAEFRHKYKSPITDGLYVDSSQAERRRSLTMLQALRRDLSLKIHRADIDVIKSEMPSKTEFRITIPLTKLQAEMYNRFVMDPLTTGYAGYFDVVISLQLINGHPSMFVEKLEERERKAALLKKQAKQPATVDGGSSDSDGEEGHGDGQEEGQEEGRYLEDIPKPYPWARPLLESHRDSGEEHSYKMLAFRQHCVALQEKTLVFSHSIPSLNILENHLKDMKVDYWRLDGKTPIADRQKGAKNFNTGKICVCLISTEAGGLGLNLPGANRIIIFDFKHSPMWETQAVGRAFRLGQKKHVYVYRFLCGGTFEDSLWNQAQLKTQLSSRVVDKKAPRREAQKKMLRMHLQPLREIEKNDLSAYVGKDPVLDRILEDGGEYIYAIEHTDTFISNIEEPLTEEEEKQVDAWLKDLQESRKKPHGVVSSIKQPITDEEIDAWLKNLQGPRKKPLVATLPPAGVVSSASCGPSTAGWPPAATLGIPSYPLAPVPGQPAAGTKPWENLQFRNDAAVPKNALGAPSSRPLSLAASAKTNGTATASTATTQPASSAALKADPSAQPLGGVAPSVPQAEVGSSSQAPREATLTSTSFSSSHLSAEGRAITSFRLLEGGRSAAIRDQGSRTMASETRQALQELNKKARTSLPISGTVPTTTERRREPDCRTTLPGTQAPRRGLPTPGPASASSNRFGLTMQHLPPLFNQKRDK